MIIIIGYFLKMKLKAFLYFFCAFTFVVLIIYKLNIYEQIFNINVNNVKLPIIVWWTPFYNNNLTNIIKCNKNKCILTENRMIAKSEIMVFLFYGSMFEPYDLPVPRKRSDLWAIIHEESPKNLALFLYKEAQILFNFTSTFSRYSNFPLTLQYLSRIDLLTNNKYLKTVEEKNKLLKKLSPILYIQSDCVTPLERDGYVAELMRYIPVDSYGQCLNNRKLPDNEFYVLSSFEVSSYRLMTLRSEFEDFKYNTELARGLPFNRKLLLENPLNNLYSDDFLHFVAQYKFVIAFENAVCYDYITEKLWRPLIAGTIPIYMGSPSVKDWLPNNNSAILAGDFNSPKELAQYILKLNNNDELYEKHLQHKFAGIQNKNLIKTLEERSWTIDPFEEPHFFEAFECYICDNIDKDILEEVSILSDSIYDCPEPISPLTKMKNESNWWNHHWKEGKCQAKILNQFIDNFTLNFSKAIFDNNVHQLLIDNEC